jgi:AmiR/NasT family two-component response regulator
MLDFLLKKYYKEKQQQSNNDKKDILEKLYQIMLKQNRPITITELIRYNDLDFLEKITTQRISAYMNKLVNSGRVQKMTDYKKTYFYV